MSHLCAINSCVSMMPTMDKRAMEDMYAVKSTGPITEPRGTPALVEHMLNDNYPTQAKNFSRSARMRSILFPHRLYQTLREEYPTAGCNQGY